MVYRILENKIKINEENKEVKKGLVITKSLETHVCCDSGIQNPNFRPVTKPSKSTLCILDWIKLNFGKDCGRNLSPWLDRIKKDKQVPKQSPPIALLK
jgi:hypothetical protein